MPQSAESFQKWIQDCGAAQLADARAWYDGLDSQWSSDRMRTEQQVLLTTLARMKTCQLVQSREGVPQDVVLDPAFWNAAAGLCDPAAVSTWQNWAQTRLQQTLIAVGLQAPSAWDQPDAAPVAQAVAAAHAGDGDLVAARALLKADVGLMPPLTARLKKVMPIFPSSDLFTDPPETLLITRPGS